MRSHTFALPRPGLRAAFCALSLVLAACGNRDVPPPGKEPAQGPSGTPTATAGARAEPAPSAAPVAAPAEVPDVLPEKFTPDGASPDHLHPAEGALLVADGTRVGRIVDDKIEWIGEVTKSRGFGGTRVWSAGGRWPDAVDVLYVNLQGRAPEPTYLALTGEAKGREKMWGEGGSPAHIQGMARVGESVLVAIKEIGAPIQLHSVRGPRLERELLSALKAGCKKEEMLGLEPDHARTFGLPPAISPDAMEGTPGGWLVTVGTLCEKRHPAAEVLDPNGKSTIVDLSPWVKSVYFDSSVRRGKGEDLYVFAGSGTVLRFREGKFEPLPGFEGPMRDAFVSPSGQPHVYDGEHVLRFDGERWTPIARTSWPLSFTTMAIDEKGTLWTGTYEAVFRLRPGAGTAWKEGCTTPFVYLYDVSYQNDTKFTFPGTRKALSTFPDVASLSLVEVNEGDQRRLGIVVTSKAQGEAVIAHVKANMKDENPKLLCYAPKSPRVIDMKAKK
jgi:hypothetical protein